MSSEVFVFVIWFLSLFRTGHFSRNALWNNLFLSRVLQLLWDEREVLEWVSGWRPREFRVRGLLVVDAEAESGKFQTFSIPSPHLHGQCYYDDTNGSKLVGSQQYIELMKRLAPPYVPYG